MKISLNIDDAVLAKAERLTGRKGNAALVRLGLETLITHECSKRLVELSETEKLLGPIPRRRKFA